MKDDIHGYIAEINKVEVKTKDDLELFRIRFLGKKGIIPALFAGMKEIEPAQRKDTGLLLNALKNRVQEKIDEAKTILDKTGDKGVEKPDLTMPVGFRETGSLHPLTIVRNEIVRIFERLGFSIAEGPEIEDDWYNFTALNFVPEHPARDMQDTFFIGRDPDIMLRTHTSSVQIRFMEKTKPPIRVILPGRVFRNEAISARAHCIFHQIEGLYVDEDVSFADLKQTLYFFATELFGPETRIRFRPSYFPFTEPSAEMDISCFICGGKGCRVCKNSGWVEILGCGMVDPNVLDNCNIDSSKYTGFAFGLGIERTAMLKYQINDIRLFFENDIRFLKQFAGEY
ncbi:MAG: phenylalanine--tRNA ligase subunit alpha [Bacteroidales bacterium]|nr:phenylalanine--tRNA ligase subunit alpha [Bacteroidales bacterium]